MALPILRTGDTSRTEMSDHRPTPLPWKLLNRLVLLFLLWIENGQEFLPTRLGHWTTLSRISRSVVSREVGDRASWWRIGTAKQAARAVGENNLDTDVTTIVAVVTAVVAVIGLIIGAITIVGPIYSRLGKLEGRVDGLDTRIDDLRNQ